MDEYTHFLKHTSNVYFKTTVGFRKHSSNTPAKTRCNQTLVKSHPKYSKGTLHKVMGKYIKMFPENKNPLSMYCTNCCNMLLERVNIFLYGRSFHLILKYCFAVKVKMIAFVKYMPHKKFMAVTVARGPHHGASECGADTGEGATPPHS